MAKQFMPHASHKERLEVMQNTAETVREETYYVVLSPDEISARESEFTDNAKVKGQLENEVKDIVAGYKDRLKPIKEKYEELLQEISIGKAERKGKLFDMPDYENSMMDTYDEDGELVSSRRLRPEEKKGQARMFVPAGLKKAANDQ